MTVPPNVRSLPARLVRSAARLATASPWARYLLVTGMLGLLTLAGTWPYARLFFDSSLGDGSDVPSGARLFWALDQQGGNPFTTARDFLLAAPEGVEVLRAANLANFLFTAPVWGLGQVIGFAEAFNAYAFFAFILSGTAAFILLDRLRFGVLAAAFGAYVFAFNPNHIDKAFGHASLAATGILPLVVLALLAKRARPTVLRAVAVGLLLGVAFYLNSYLGLFAFVLAAVFAVVEFVLEQEGISRYEVARSYYFLALAFLLGLVPLGASWYFDPSSVSSLAGARTEVLPGGSAAAQLYLLPGPRQPWLGGPMSEWLKTNLSWESTMFFGYTTIALAAAGVVLAVVRNQRKTLARDAQFVVVFALVLTVIGVWASLPPKVRVGEFPMLLLYTTLAIAAVTLGESFLRRRWSPARVPMAVGLFSAALTMSILWILMPSAVRAGDFEVATPSYFLREATTLYRVFSRFGILVGLGLIILAAYALSSLPWHRYRAALPVAALVIVAFELYVGPPEVVSVQDIKTPVTVREIARSASSRPIIMDISEPPAYLNWLREQSPGNVVDYPNPLAPDPRWAWKDVFYQQIHEHALWQGPGATNGSRSVLQEYAADLGQPHTPRVLAVANVKYVVVHRDRYKALRLPQPTARCGLEPVAAFPADDVAVYEVSPKPDRGFAVRDQGFYSVANRKVWPEDRGFRWMPEKSEVLVFSPRDDDVFLTGSAFSLDRSRELDVFASSGEQVGAWEILVVETGFRFALRVRKGMNRFVFGAKPGAVRKGGDARKRAVAVSSFTVSPIRGAAQPSRSGSADNACDSPG